MRAACRIRTARDRLGASGVRVSFVDLFRTRWPGQWFCAWWRGPSASPPEQPHPDRKQHFFTPATQAAVLPTDFACWGISSRNLLAAL